MKLLTKLNNYVTSTYSSIFLVPVLLMCLQLTSPVQSQDEIGFLLDANELMALAQHGYGHYEHHPPPPKPKKHHHSHHWDKGGHDSG